MELRKIKIVNGKITVKITSGETYKVDGVEILENARVFVNGEFMYEYKKITNSYERISGVSLADIMKHAERFLSLDKNTKKHFDPKLA